MNKLYVSVAVCVALGLTACSGDDGNNGENGNDGVDALVEQATDGKNGENGNDGVNALVEQVTLVVGNSNCLNGGLQVDTGADDDNDGSLSITEITSTQYICNAPRVTLNNSEILSSVNNSWYVQSATTVNNAKEYAEEVVRQSGRAKNVILFVGDGMGVSTVTAARILDGQNKGMQGEENVLSFGHFPFAGLAKTYNVDAQTPDSAGTMTAMMTGVKTDVGVIGVDEDIVRGDCATVAGNELVTALELAEIAGKSTGIISTARITHATPAATYAKSADRNWEDVSDMPADAVTAGCEDIASQLVNFESNIEARFVGVDVDGIEVVMGGGRRHFLPKDPAANSPDAVSGTEGDRTDGRNLVTEWTTAYPDGLYVFDDDGFYNIDTARTARVFGLFNESHMQYEADRGNDIAGEPSISDMTETALEILDNNRDGYFLMVESGRIDHAHHAGSAYGALTDTIAFAAAVQTAVDNTNPEDTLIIVTADHSHVFTIAGYPKRGNPILGKVVPVGSDVPSLASDAIPYTTLGYTNGLGFRNLGAEMDADAAYSAGPVSGRVDVTSIDTTTPGYHQETLVPLGSETHAGEDVGVYANGPGAQLVSGTNEQNMIFHVMNFASDLVAEANEVISALD
tara:strand:- start:1673 stop:3559 length:1887 start_codon:yes stop_codon:yes gene_type:complete